MRTVQQPCSLAGSPAPDPAGSRRDHSRDEFITSPAAGSAKRQQDAAQASFCDALAYQSCSLHAWAYWKRPAQPRHNMGQHLDCACLISLMGPSGSRHICLGSCVSYTAAEHPGGAFTTCNMQLKAQLQQCVMDRPLP